MGKYLVRFIYIDRGVQKKYPQDKVVSAESKREAIKKIIGKMPKKYNIWSVYRFPKREWKTKMVKKWSKVI
jgi:hypothetical protein